MDHHHQKIGIILNWVFGHATTIWVDEYKVYQNNKWDDWFENQND
jgi:hypothetical protein